MGPKGLVTVTDRYRESSEFRSWVEAPRDLENRGVATPVLAGGDGVLGLWDALEQAPAPDAKQRC